MTDKEKMTDEERYKEEIEKLRTANLRLRKAFDALVDGDNVIHINRYLIAHSIKFYGENTQLVTCMEELAELQQAISKHIRGNADRDNEIEEIADVLICLEIAQKIFRITDTEIKEMLKEKQERLKQRTGYVNGYFNYELYDNDDEEKMEEE
jgi:NTP pyrophosphatase (non-canonical NTP hydrolase)